MARGLWSMVCFVFYIWSCYLYRRVPGVLQEWTTSKLHCQSNKLDHKCTSVSPGWELDLGELS